MTPSTSGTNRFSTIIDMPEAEFDNPATRQALGLDILERHGTQSSPSNKVYKREFPAGLKPKRYIPTCQLCIPDLGLIWENEKAQ
jgi:hypothetical protein